MSVCVWCGGARTLACWNDITPCGCLRGSGWVCERPTSSRRASEVARRRAHWMAGGAGGAGRSRAVGDASAARRRHEAEMATERGREGGVEISAKSPSSCTRSWRSAVRVQRRDGGEFGGWKMAARNELTEERSTGVRWQSLQSVKFSGKFPVHGPHGNAWRPGLWTARPTSVDPPCPRSTPLRASFSRECPRVRREQAEDPCHRPIPLQ